MVHCIDTCFEYHGTFVEFFPLRFVDYGPRASHISIYVA
jgi:hypothetical protein